MAPTSLLTMTISIIQPAPSIPTSSVARGVKTLTLNGVAMDGAAVVLDAGLPKMKKSTVATLEMTLGSVAGLPVYLAGAVEFKKNTVVVELTLDPKAEDPTYHEKYASKMLPWASELVMAFSWNTPAKFWVGSDAVETKQTKPGAATSGPGLNEVRFGELSNGKKPSSESVARFR